MQLIRRYVVLAISGFLFTSVNAAEPPPQEWPSHAKQDAQWLTAGVDRFPALLKLSAKPRVKGTAILIPEAGKQAISPDHMSYLRIALTDYGWNTLLITPPAWPELAQTQEGWQLYANQLLQRLKAGQEKADTLAGNQLIIAEGTSAASLLTLYGQEKADEPDALVVISPYLPSPSLNHNLIRWYGESDYPLLDVHASFDNRWTLATVSARATAAHKQVRLDFRQVKMAVPPPNAGSQQWLTRQIHGWIDHLGW